MAEIYIAIIGDVVASRHAEARSLLQDQLRAALRRVNEEFSRLVVAQFLITVGDEFQGLLGAAEGIDRLLSLLRARVNPAELRIGLGYGPLHTPVRSQAIGMDGPCFHRARAAIDRAKATETAIEVDLGQPTPVFEIYSLLYSELRRRLTSKQRRVLDMAGTGMEGVRIASQLEISPSAVSQHLRAAGHESIRKATRSWADAVRSTFEVHSQGDEEG
jgi:hypothetical protein